MADELTADAKRADSAGCYDVAIAAKREAICGLTAYTDISAVPRGRYGVILADPPWSFALRSPKGDGRSPSQHYNTMSMADIKALPIVDLAAKDCHLFMWVTGPNLVRGDHIGVMRAWGFEPSSLAFVWLKCKKKIARQGILHGWVDESCFAMGMGFTTRQNAEFLLLGRKGKPRRLSKSIHQIIIAPRREHSHKPDETHDRIEQYADGPYLELFARQERAGWDAWGDQVGRFSENAA